MRPGCARAWIALVGLMSAATTHAGVNEWTTKGPPGGTYRAFEASPSDPNVFYAAYGHGFHYSTDGGVTWSSHEFVNEVVNVAVDPQDSKRVFACVLSEGLYRSTDGGVTFTKVAPGTSYQIWSAAVGPNNVVYYASTSEFRRSTDGGDTFGPAVSVQQTFEHIYVNSQDPNKLYVIRGPALMRSTNGGATWSESSVGFANNWLYSLVELPNGALVAATSSGIYTRADENAAWTQRTFDLTWSVAADPLAPTTLLASRNGAVPLERSTDSGVTWNSIGSPTVGRARRAVISRAGSNVFLTANENGVQRSTDSGAHWQDATRGPIASGGASIATTLAENAPIYAYMYNAGGALYASTNDSDWERLAPELISLQIGQAEIAVRPGTPRTVYLAGFMRGVYRSSDGGMTFATPGSGLQGLQVTSIAFDPIDADIMYAGVFDMTAHPASFYRSTDGGANWNPRSVGLTDVWARRIAVDPADGNRMFIAGIDGVLPGDVGGLYASADAGVHWNRIAFAGEDVEDVQIDPSDSNRIYVTSTTGLHISTNGGASFTTNDAFAVITGGRGGELAIDPVVPSTVYATSWYDSPCCTPTPSSFVLRSVDRGQSWEVLRDQTGPSWYVNRLLLDPNTPSRVIADTSIRGIASYEIANDLTLAISGHSGVRNVGEPSSLHLHAQHLGKLAATDVSISTTFPPTVASLSGIPDNGICSASASTLTCRIGVMQPGATADIDVSYTPVSPVIVAVSSSIAAHEADNVEENNTVQATAIAGHVVDLSVSLAASTSTVDRGDALSYQAIVSNSGPHASDSSVLTFSLTNGGTVTELPPGCVESSGQVNCSIGAIAVGASAALKFAAVANNAGTLTANASVSSPSNTGDSNIANNTAQAEVAARSISDLAVSLTDTPDPVTAGQSFEYQATVTNLGPESASGVTLTVNVPGSVTSVVPSQGTCNNASGSISCAIDTLPVEGNIALDIKVLAGAAGTISASATVSTASADRNSANNAAQQSTIVAAPVANSTTTPGTSGGKSGGGGGSSEYITLVLASLLNGLRHRTNRSRFLIH
ncbi:MAG TPA: hypothetical protein VFS24_15160 [Steroidobacteraceae bacterium]|nr:hypothetical protein [Steroidobacteraceae bacterium]